MANLMKDPGARCQLSPTLDTTWFVWEANNPGQCFPNFFCPQTADRRLCLSLSWSLFLNIPHS